MKITDLHHPVEYSSDELDSGILMPGWHHPVVSVEDLHEGEVSVVIWPQGPVHSPKGQHTVLTLLTLWGKTQSKSLMVDTP